MTNPFQTPAAINQRNTEFWNLQTQITLGCITHPELLEHAIIELDSESVRAVPIYNRKTFESALEEALQAKERFHTRVAQQGGRAAKTDPLGLRIQQLAMQNPTIHINELWHQLRKEVGNGLIVAIDPDSNEPGCVRKIHYQASDGKTKAAPVRALKHRLARAKAKVGLAS